MCIAECQHEHVRNVYTSNVATGVYQYVDLYMNVYINMATGALCIIIHQCVHFVHECVHFIHECGDWYIMYRS